MNNIKYWVMDDLVDQMVMVYEDPITKLIPEGKAILLEPVKFDNNDDLSIWIVRFIIDEPDEYCQRTIDKKDIIIE